MKPWIARLLQKGVRWIGQRIGAPPKPPDTSAAATLPAPVLEQAEATPPLACVTVVIPALNEARRIASVVAYALADPATAEVVVVDDSSIDDTAALARQAGARVVTSSMLGTGPSMHDGMLA
ncbi:MAG TPA: glycosyltransferase, partial [Rubrivivax sp.]|nr:glycosyltransferase [Rubrivivax sp.]